MGLFEDLMQPWAWNTYLGLPLLVSQSGLIPPLPGLLVSVWQEGEAATWGSRCPCLPRTRAFPACVSPVMPRPAAETPDMVPFRS